MVLLAELGSSAGGFYGEGKDVPWQLDRIEYTAYALGYGILSLLRLIVGQGASGPDAGALEDHWRLDRKLEDAFGSLGIPRIQSRRVLAIMKAILVRTAAAENPKGPAGAQPSVNGSPPEPKVLARYLAFENYDTEDFRTLLGVNLFNDIVWFNKEAFEEFLSFAPLFLVLENPAAFKSRKEIAETGAAGWRTWRDLVFQTTELFCKAEAVSGYRLDRFIEVLSGEKDAGIFSKTGSVKGKKQRP